MYVLIIVACNNINITELKTDEKSIKIIFDNLRIKQIEENIKLLIKKLLTFWKENVQCK